MSMTEARLFMLQRVSAAVLAPMILIHLATILYAVRGGLTAGEILARTSGASFWTAFYTLFVIAAAIHAPLGLRKILVEWGRMRRRAADLTALAIGMVLLGLGLRAVAAVSGAFV